MISSVARYAIKEFKQDLKWRREPEVLDYGVFGILVIMGAVLDLILVPLQLPIIAIGLVVKRIIKNPYPPLKR